MSLLGRLEDLSLPDIIQIVFLSRRTGILEIVDGTGRSTIVFRQGLVVDASSPADPDLESHLGATGVLDAVDRAELERMIDAGAQFGTALVELGAADTASLSEAVRRRIVQIVTPLLGSRDGEFNFILSDAAGQADLEYDPDTLFRDGGIPPQQLLGAAEGEKLKPLSGLEESMRAGKALLSSSRRPAETRSAPPPAAPEGEEELRLDALEEELTADLEPFAAEQRRPEVTIDPGDPFETFFPGADVPGVADLTDLPPPAESPDASLDLLDETPPAAEIPPDAFIPAPVLPAPLHVETIGETVVLYEPDPLLRVAARRAFTRKGFDFLQFASLDDARAAAADLIRRGEFFVMFLDLAAGGGDDTPERLLRTVKEADAALPVLVIDDAADLRRRHDLLSAGADFYLTKPSPAHLQPGLAEETLGLFAEELMMFAERSFQVRKSRKGANAPPEIERELLEMSGPQRTERSFALLRRLISELTNPDDLRQMADTILRIAGEYLERAALFAVHEDRIEGIHGFGPSGEGDELGQRVRHITIGRPAGSFLDDVVASKRRHQGKVRHSDANAAFLRSLGRLQPSEIVLLPVANRGKVVGIVYGDNAVTRSQIPDVSGLEIFLSQAGLAFESALVATARGKDGADRR